MIPLTGRVNVAANGLTTNKAATSPLTMSRARLSANLIPSLLKNSGSNEPDVTPTVEKSITTVAFAACAFGTTSAEIAAGDEQKPETHH